MTIVLLTGLILACVLVGGPMPSAPAVSDDPGRA